MKARFFKIGFVLLFLFSVFYEVKASDCYRYHTRREISVKVENGKVFLVNIIKDPNGISVVSYGKNYWKEFLRKMHDLSVLMVIIR